MKPLLKFTATVSEAAQRGAALHAVVLNGVYVDGVQIQFYCETTARSTAARYNDLCTGSKAVVHSYTPGEVRAVRDCNVSGK